MQTDAQDETDSWRQIRSEQHHLEGRRQQLFQSNPDPGGFTSQLTIPAEAENLVSKVRKKLPCLSYLTLIKVLETDSLDYGCMNAESAFTVLFPCFLHVHLIQLHLHICAVLTICISTQSAHLRDG